MVFRSDNWVDVRYIHTAAQFGNVGHGHPEMVQFLIDSGAQASVKSRFGTTPLHPTAGNYVVEAIRIILAQWEKELVNVDPRTYLPSRGGY